MMMRIAIPQWQGRVAPVFDVAGSLLVVDFEDEREARREEIRLVRTDAPGRAAEFSHLNADVLICGAISAPLEARLSTAGVTVIGFVCGAVEDILSGFVKGELSSPAFLMPGCWDRRRKWRPERSMMPRGFGMGLGADRGRGAGSGHGRMDGSPAAGRGGECACPSHDEKAPHEVSRLFVQVACPKCGKRSGAGIPGTMNPSFGRGFGRRGCGRRWRNWFHGTRLTRRQRASGWSLARGPQAFAATTRDEELDALKAQARHFESALEDIQERIEKLEPKTEQQ